MSLYFLYKIEDGIKNIQFGFLNQVSYIQILGFPKYM